MTSSAGVSFFSGPTAMRDKPRFLWGPYFWLFQMCGYPHRDPVPISIRGWMSFEDRYHHLIGFAGLANYVEVLGSRQFWDTTLISLIYVVGSLTGAIILGMVAALALNAAGTMGTLLRSSSFFPGRCLCRLLAASGFGFSTRHSGLFHTSYRRSGLTRV